MFDLVQSGPTIAASFLASLVEFVEALTIVLAVGTVRGWKSALTGCFAGVFLLVVLVALFGPLLATAPLAPFQVFVGTLLLLFGARWLRKAILRSAGVIPMRDEAAAYTREVKTLGALTPHMGAYDPIAIVTTFKAVVLEGLEVVFIVIAIGARGQALAVASAGAAAAMIVVVLLGLWLHKPLARVPENGLKFVVGVLLTAFGLFWIGEGLGDQWPFGDVAILLIAGALLVLAYGCVVAIHRTVPKGAQVAGDTR